MGLHRDLDIRVTRREVIKKSLPSTLKSLILKTDDQKGFVLRKNNAMRLSSS